MWLFLSFVNQFAFYTGLFNIQFPFSDCAARGQGTGIYDFYLFLHSYFKIYNLDVDSLAVPFAGKINQVGDFNFLSGFNRFSGSNPNQAR